MTHMNPNSAEFTDHWELIIKGAILQSLPIMQNRSDPIDSLSVWLSYRRHQLLQKIRRVRIAQEFCQRSKICCLAF